MSVEIAPLSPLPLPNGHHQSCRLALLSLSLSFRDVEELLAQRGITVSYESIRRWCATFGVAYARRLRHRTGPLGDTWHLDELFVTIRGQRQYPLGAVDQEGDVIDILLQPRRDRHAAARFLRKLLKRSGRTSRASSPIASGATAPRIGWSCPPSATTPRATPTPARRSRTNRGGDASSTCGGSNRRRKRRGSSRSTACVWNLFSPARHLLRAQHQRLLRARAFVTWNAVAAVWTRSRQAARWRARVTAAR